jgi:hypothetical protein
MPNEGWTISLIRCHMLAGVPKPVSFFLFATVASATPISVTTFKQTTQTSVHTVANDQQCTMSGAFSSTCFSQPTGPQGQLVSGSASASISAEQFGPSQPPFTVFSAGAGAFNPTSSGTAFASLAQSVLITGGTGTGYLNVVFVVESGGGGVRRPALMSVGSCLRFRVPLRPRGPWFRSLSASYSITLSAWTWV